MHIHWVVLNLSSSLNVRMVDEILTEYQLLMIMEFVSLIISTIKTLSIQMTFMMYTSSWITAMRNTKSIQNSGIDQTGKLNEKNVLIMLVIDL